MVENKFKIKKFILTSPCKRFLSDIEQASEFIPSWGEKKTGLEYFLIIVPDCKK